MGENGGRVCRPIRNSDRYFSAGAGFNLLRLPRIPLRQVMGANERQFIQLALGSAIYRHRLVYGELPRSLEQLVEMGLLEAAVPEGRELA